MRLGTWFAVMYAVPRHPAPTLCAKTSVRTRPNTREMAVRPAMSMAPRVMPIAILLGPAGPPGSSSTVPAPVSDPSAPVRPVLSVCNPAPPALRAMTCGPEYASGYDLRGPLGGLMTPFGRSDQPVRSRATSRVAYGLSWPPRDPASLAARCPPTVTGAYLAGFSALTQLGRHSMSASTLPSWK